MQLDERSCVELWGGLECTVMRIGDAFRNEIVETGHAQRLGDLERIAALGIGTLRYPVLWETVSPQSPDAVDWHWQDERLGRLRALGIAPIAGLVHHGGGPHYTNLLDPDFPRMLAAHAARVAERYPWIGRYTPVNEPLTTARFSALYGHWYPHRHDEPSFLRALVNQCAAVVAAMAAIRRINPDAELVQTEDVGKTFSTPLLHDQAAYENERRWLSLDLLCGRVDRTHPWHDILLRNNITERELGLFIGAPCCPDIIGVNHYLTSERFLDERSMHYPEHLHGGNARNRYADVEAVRVDLPDGSTGPEARLREVWSRYRLPLAVTETHHGSSRDEQIRWLHGVWTAAATLRQEGVDLRAVAIWSLFGAMDWNSLLTRRAGFYEPGAFDVRSTPPRATALATAAQSLATRGTFDHPVLDGPGWWQRDGRYYDPRCRTRACETAGPPRHLLVTGATGTLGRAFARISKARGLEHVLVSRAELDIADPASVEAALARWRPWAVVNAAGYVRVADAAREPELCFRENALGPEALAQVTARQGMRLVTFSSDLVFDGRLGRPYVEGDPPSPRCVYGRSKAEAERRVLRANPDALVVRTSAFFGPWDRWNFAASTLSALAARNRLEVAIDETVSPTYVPDLVHATLDLLIDEEAGVWHLANGGASSWYEFALRLADRAKLDPRRLIPTGGERRDTSLASERGAVMPALGCAIDRFFRDCESDWATPPKTERVGQGSTGTR
ncbi:MAG: family 1 glycosylhydrolase [Rhodoplanes sp.]